MEKKLTFKQALTFAAATIPSRMTDPIDLSTNHLIAVTAAGVLYGDYVSEAPGDNSSQDIKFTIFDSLRKSASDISDGTQNCILLKDAILINSSGFKTTFEFFYLCMDDVIGLSIGELP